MRVALAPRFKVSPKLDFEKERPVQEEGSKQRKGRRLERPAPEIDTSALDARAALLSAIAAMNARQFEELKMASVSLVDSFGNLHGGACDAVRGCCSCKSVRPKVAARHLEGSTKPDVQVFSSLLRLEELESAQLPFIEAQPQLRLS